MNVTRRSVLLWRLPQLKQLDGVMIRANDDDDDDDDDSDTAADSDHAANASHRILSGIECVRDRVGLLPAKTCFCHSRGLN